MRSLGAIVLGIGDYRYDRSHFPLLRFAPTDAEEIAKYLRACWPTESSSIIAIEGEDATREAIDGAFAVLLRDAPFELLVIFLSGHGLVEKQEAGFVIQPSSDSSDIRLLDATALDRLLASVPARQVVFVLDCCHAEGITRRMTFFSGLGQSDARLFIASSREDQLTWEDERVGHGIFTAHVLDLLRTGSSSSLDGLRDALDVDSELFPILCNQVPLYVLEHKREKQEPVKGGVSIRSVTLPVARAARRIRSRTAFGTAIQRVRQIVTGLAAGGAAFMFFAYTLAYYSEADRNGSVRVYHGIKWLAPIFRFVPTLRVDTGISTNDLSPDPTSRYAVQTGAASGVWTHMTARGFRSWYGTVRSGLARAAGQRYDVLAASGEPPPVSRLDEESLPADIAFAAWANLDTDDSSQLDAIFARMPGADRIAKLDVPFSMRDMDFNIMDLTQMQLASFADALRFSAACDPTRTFAAYLGFLKANQIWAAHTSAEQHGNEAKRRAAEDVADVFAAIVKGRLDRGEMAVSQEMLSKFEQLESAGYGDFVILARSRTTGSPDERKSAARRALSRFHGNSSLPEEVAAIREIGALLDSSEDSQSIVNEVYKRFVASSGPEQSDLTAFLIAAANRNALPPTLIIALLDKAKDAVGRGERLFMDSEYARILAHAIGQVPAASRDVVYRLIDLVAADVTPKSSSTAEIYLALARRQLETPAMFQRIVDNASMAAAYSPENPTAVAEPLPGISIVVGYGPWLEALSAIGAQRALTPQAIVILERHAEDPALRGAIVRALARQERYQSIDFVPLLRSYPKDGAKRALTVDVLAERLATLPRAQFLPILQKIRQERSATIEPEIRIALGLLAINSQWARVRTTSYGDWQFE